MFLRIVCVSFKWLSTLQVGTVLNVEDAKKAVGAGAKFLMSPAMVKVSLYILLLSFPTSSSYYDFPCLSL